MKHKRHQKDRRDKSDKPSSRHEDHHYSREAIGPKQYKMKDLSENCGDENAPKTHFKFIILVIIVRRVSIARKNYF